MKKQKLRLAYTMLAFSIILCLPSCSTFTVQAVQASKSDDTHDTTLCSYFWGLSEPLLQANCNGNGIQIVKAKTNILYSLCNIITLGIVSPMGITYRCTSAPLQRGNDLGKKNQGGQNE